MKHLSSAFFFRALMGALFVATLLVSLATLLLWISSSLHPASETFTFHGNVYHFQSQHGRLSLTIFSTTAEDDMYRTAQFSFWAVEALTLPIPILLAALMIRKRRRARSSGFPVQQLRDSP